MIITRTEALALLGAGTQPGSLASARLIDELFNRIEALEAAVTIGGMEFNNPHNSYDSGIHSFVLLGGNSTFENHIGLEDGLPEGTDWTPSGWAADTGYVAGDASVSAILGGHDNINNQPAGIIGGGGHNFIKYNAGGHSIIGGGSYNVNQGQYSGIYSGRRNTIIGDSSAFSFIGGGEDNNIVGSGSGVPCGTDIDITGDYSFGAGTGHRVGDRSFAFGNNVLAAAQAGVVAFTDSVATTVTISTDNIFVTRFANGYRLLGGKVAIGAANWTPSRQFEVRGAAALSNADDTGAFLFLAGASRNYLYSRAGQASSTGVPLTFTMGGSDAMTIASNNRVGIGTTAPLALLHVVGGMVLQPGASAPTLDTNGQVSLELTNDTTITFKARGSDGTTRAGTVTIS